MSETEIDFASRREQLAAQIARQRGELAQAYRNLEKPIHYTEYAMRGFGFIRQNPWILAAVPAGLSVISTLFGFRKSPKPRIDQMQSQSETPKNTIKLWIGRAYELYQLYRRVRSFIP